MGDWVGWLATGLFGISYLCKRELHLLWVQAAGASVWMTYGIVLRSPPLIVANVIVATMAAQKAIRTWRQERTFHTATSSG